MNKRFVFTIVAKNYIGLAEILGESVKTHNPNVSFVIFIADEFEEKEYMPDDLKHHFRIGKKVLDIPQETWINMAFKYNLTEFCTALKPFCFQYLFNHEQATSIIYLDPDIYCFSDFSVVWEKLGNTDVVVTPHLSVLEKQYSGNVLETNFLASGVFNLGFLALRKSFTSHTFLDWWAERLIDRCFQERLEGLYTDQKWIDFLPCFFSNTQLTVLRDLGYNIAPWNFHERKLVVVGDTIHVTCRSDNRLLEKLVFVHYSGFNYKELNGSFSTNRNIPELKEYTDLKVLFETYAEVISRSSFFKYSQLRYTYNYFSNSLPIVHFHRRAYRRLCKQMEISMPFDEQGILYKLFKKSDLLVEANTMVDKMNERTFSGFDMKLKRINSLNKLVFKVIGAKRYFLLTKFFLRYYRPENQVFLIRSRESNYSFWNENFRM